jgi:hypothetical protein
VYPRLLRVIHVAFVAALAAGTLAGCGGESGVSGPVVSKTVRGPGFTFAAPEGRELARTPRSVSVLPAEAGSQELASVTIFPLVKPFRPALWPQASRELDKVAGQLADTLGGELEQEPETVRLAGLRGRRYEIAYEREGVELRQRLTLLLSRRTEYQLLCRWPADGETPDVCERLETSFRLSS